MNSDSKDITSKPDYSWVWKIIFVIAAAGLLFWIPIPNFIRGGPGKITGIINRLRQIDAAKQEWAIEHGITNAAQLNRELTPQDLAPYLLTNFTQKDFGNPIYGEHYYIKNLNESLEVELTKDLREYGWPNNWKLPKGTVVKFGTNGIEEYLLPGQESEPCKSLTEAISGAN